MTLLLKANGGSGQGCHPDPADYLAGDRLAGLNARHLRELEGNEVNKPMIENSERGVTLNKSLAWAILVALVTGGIWVGQQVGQTASSVKSLSERGIEDRIAIQNNAQAINGLRSSNARIDEKLINIERSSSRTEQTMDEILRYLREGRNP